MSGQTEISATELAHLIGAPDAPHLIDVCIDEDFALDPRLIPGAKRCPYSEILGLAPDLRERRTVVICQKGKKLSQGAAALLRAEGVAAAALVGGMVGWAAAGLPAVPAAAIPGPLWVAQHRAKNDEIACAWLIRRFVDADARILFVPPEETAAVAEKFDATAIDAKGAGAGHESPFSALLHRFGLETPPLLQLAAVIRGAQTEQSDRPAEAAGLFAMLQGLSRLHADDLRQLEAAMTLFDALYRWARDATEERQDRPGAGA